MSAAWCAPARWPSASTRLWRSSINAASGPASRKFMHIIWRRRRQDLYSRRRYRRFRRHALQCRRSAASRRRAGGLTLCHPWRPVGAARSLASRPPPPWKELVLTDTIQPTEAVRVAKNIRVISIGPLIGEAIARTAKKRASRACLIKAAISRSHFFLKSGERRPLREPCFLSQSLT